MSSQGEEIAKMLGETVGRIMGEMRRGNTTVARYERREYLRAKEWRGFVQRLERAEGAEIRHALRELEDTFADMPDTHAQGVLVADFISQYGPSVMAMFPKSARVSEEAAFNCLEKLCLEAVYSQAFGRCLMDDLSLSNHIAALEFITPRHLGVGDALADPSLYTSATEELYMISSKHSALEKLECIVAFMRIVLWIMENLPGGGGRAGTVGADDLMPVVVWIVLKANPPCLLSNIEFIKTFRYPPLLREEAAYYFVTFSSAVHFVLNIKPEDVGLDPADFELGLKDAGEFRRIEANRTRQLAEDAENRRRALIKRNRERFRSCLASDLDQEDVAILLDEYRNSLDTIDELRTLVSSLKEQLVLNYPTPPPSTTDITD